MTKRKKSGFTYNTQFPINEKDVIACEYYFKSDHRDNSAKKSQWLIKPDKEKSCFIESHKMKWSEERRSWGLLLVGSKAKHLGINHENEQLNVAVFVDSFKKNVWHGYPADFKRDITDLPIITVLEKWRSLGYFKKCRISQAKNGKICSL